MSKCQLLNKYLMWRRIKELYGIITVSEFSKKELIKYCGLDFKTILVVYNSAEHFIDVGRDDSVFDEFLELKKDSYYYTLSSLSPNKNFNWIIKEAIVNPQETFVVTGMKLDVFEDDIQKDIPRNVIFTGYLSDEKVKSLMCNCKTFLFPTFYEGFGIPPLEALYCGAKITVSDTPCMREIYGGVPNYIDPLRADYNSMEIMGKDIEKDAILKKYSWMDSGRKILKYIKGL